MQPVFFQGASNYTITGGNFISVTGNHTSVHYTRSYDSHSSESSRRPTGARRGRGRTANAVANVGSQRSDSDTYTSSPRPPLRDFGTAWREAGYPPDMSGMRNFRINDGTFINVRGRTVNGSQTTSNTRPRGPQSRYSASANRSFVVTRNGVVTMQSLDTEYMSTDSEEVWDNPPPTYGDSRDDNLLAAGSPTYRSSDDRHGAQSSVSTSVTPEVGPRQSSSLTMLPYNQPDRVRDANSARNVDSRSDYMENSVTSESRTDASPFEWRFINDFASEMDDIESVSSADTESSISSIDTMMDFSEVYGMIFGRRH